MTSHTYAGATDTSYAATSGAYAATTTSEVVVRGEGLPDAAAFERYRAPLTFIGTGWAWPLAVDSTGGIAMVEGTTELEQAMYLILATTPGERPMRPEFGSRLREFVFAAADATTAGLIAGEVRASLLRWEPRIDVESVVVTADPDDAATLWIDIAYVVRETYDRRNLVVPFYTIPEEN